MLMSFVLPFIEFEDGVSNPLLLFHSTFSLFFFLVDPGQPIWPVTQSLDRVNDRVGFQNYGSRVKLKKKKKRRKISMNKSLIAKWQNFRGQIKDDHFSWKKIAMFLNQLFILFLLILEETGSSKIAPNLIQNMDWIYLLTKPTSGLSFFHPHVAPPMQGWFVSNSLAMVPCFPQTWRNDPCLSSSPGSLSWER